MKLSKRMKCNVAIGLAAAIAVLIMLSGYYFRHVGHHHGHEVIEQFQDEPGAHDRFDAMMMAMQKAQTLSYEGELEWKNGRYQYRVQLMKPNYFRLECLGREGKPAGIMVGDGNDMWIIWPGVRPKFVVEERADYNRTRTQGYIKMDASPRKHSIKAEATCLTHNMGFPVIDPSFFHGCWNTLLDHINAVRYIGKKRIEGVNCTGIELRFMEGQRSWYLWLSDQDEIPRRLKEIVRAGTNTIITSERYFNIKINEEIEASVFYWRPTEGWNEVVLPGAEENVLKVGQTAPEIALSSIDGDEIALSDYRGRVVWLTVWRVGCPPCRIELPALERLYREYAQMGLVVLGVNFIDDKRIVSDFLEKNEITFPNIVDSSPAAMNVMLSEYSGDVVPANYLIDREGTIIDCWHGYEKGETRGYDMLREALANGHEVE